MLQIGLDVDRSRTSHQGRGGDWTVVGLKRVDSALHGLALQHADEILTRQAVADMVEFEGPAIKLVEETIPAVIKLGELQAVLQRLLAERVPIWISNALWERTGDWAPHTKDPDVLLEYVRNALGRTITARLATDEADGFWRIRAGDRRALEAELTAGIERTGAGIQIGLAPIALRPLLEAPGRCPSCRSGVSARGCGISAVRLGLVRILESPDRSLCCGVQRD